MKPFGGSLAMTLAGRPLKHRVVFCKLLNANKDVADTPENRRKVGMEEGS